MAAEGIRFTDWYAPAPVCTPTRAGLLTGCYPQRLGFGVIPKERPNGADAHVLYSRSQHGLNLAEVTIAEMLKARGYATGMVGKWHLGDAPEFLPTRQGFDLFFGLPYSNDMKPSVLMRGERVVEEPVEQATLTRRYTDESIKFVRENKDRPFFLYLAHNMPHTPLHASEQFRGKSPRGLYGDVVEELDWNVGRLLDALKELGLDERTLVVFTSDNGPWHMRGEDGGSATPLRAGKGTTYEGGMRVPFIARLPGRVPAGKASREPLSHIDLAPTIAALTGAAMPTDRIIDGKDVSPILLGTPGAKNPHEAFFYYGDGRLNAVRSGKWKLKLETTLQEETYYGKVSAPEAKIPPALYDLELDPGEQKSVLADHPDVAKRLQGLAETAREDLGDARLGVVGRGVRPIGRVANSRRPGSAATRPATGPARR
jgi:arylsulfatase A-like enzyme